MKTMSTSIFHPLAATLLRFRGHPNWRECSQGIKFGIDDATLDKCRAILEAPLLESWEPLERKAAGGEEHVLERLNQFKVCLDCNGSTFFNRAETDPVYLIADR